MITLAITHGFHNLCFPVLDLCVSNFPLPTVFTFTLCFYCSPFPVLYRLPVVSNTRAFYLEARQTIVTRCFHYTRFQRSPVQVSSVCISLTQNNFGIKWWILRHIETSLQQYSVTMWVWARAGVWSLWVWSLWLGFGLGLGNSCARGSTQPNSNLILITTWTPVQTLTSTTSLSP